MFPPSIAPNNTTATKSGVAVLKSESYAHSVRVDQEDNIWVADKGSDMVIKFSPEGRVAMVFGRKQERLTRNRASGAPEPAADSRRRNIPPGNRHGVG